MSEVDHTGHRDRLRNKYMQNGIESLEAHEVLEMLLFYAIPRRNTNEIAHQLLNEYGSLSAVLDAPLSALQNSKLSYSASVFLKVLPDLCRAYYNDRYNNTEKIFNADNIIPYMVKKFIGKAEENAILLLLDTKFREKYCSVISQGSISAVDINIQKIISIATSYNAAFAVIAHNHPSGNPLPSQLDLSVTRRIYDALKIVNIKLLDHIIVGDDDAVSFAKMGIMEDILDESFMVQ